MRKTECFLLLCTVYILAGCAAADVSPGTPLLPSDSSAIPQVQTAVNENDGEWLSWGHYDLEISRDASGSSVIPDRHANDDYLIWGVHLNVVKLLEVDPCKNCLSISNVHMLPGGDVSIDISITHPYSNMPALTGFDVRGIIMFPASQMYPDSDLRVAAGYDPWTEWQVRIASYEKGDAELMNPDGWTTIWGEWEDKNNEDYTPWHPIADGDFPILRYFPGKYASGDNLSMISAFRHFYSNETRHMFETGKTVTRTYIIRPPASGPIQASYAVYAHWTEPAITPVTNPAEDFPPEANAPMPYEFSITQDAVIDPDMPINERTLHLHVHVKTWHFDSSSWMFGGADIAYVRNPGGGLFPHPSGVPNDYRCVWIWPDPYIDIPGYLPGIGTYIYRLEVRNPEDMEQNPPLGTDWYIAKIAIDAPDGIW